MSARTPFIPQKSAVQRSATPAQNDQNTSVSQAHLDTFQPNGILPVDNSSENNTAKQQSSFSQPEDSTHFETANALPTGLNKPLNLSGFAKRDKPQQQFVPHTRSRKSLENSASDNRGQKAVSPHQQALRTMAPRPSSPFFPSSNGLVSMSNFRTPALPVHSRLQSSISSEELGEDAAHIPTPAVHSADKAAPYPQQSGPPSRYQPVTAHRSVQGDGRMRSIAHPSLENIQETADEDDDEHAPTNQARALDMTDPQRQGSEGLYDDFGDTHNDQGRQGLRRTSKRSHKPDEDEEYDYGNVSKRYKLDPSANDPTRPQSRMSTPATPYLHAAHMDGGRFSPAGDNPGAYSHLQTPQAQATMRPRENEHALHRLFGQDLEAYIDVNANNYEQSKKKWAECSMEEWRAGADEIAGRFTRMIDFVKDHMTTKLTLYASLHSTVAAHRSTLSDRDKMLKDARESLVRGGGNVVGRGAGLIGGDKDKKESGV